MRPYALYVVGTLNESARWASIGVNTALSIAGSFLPGSGLYDAFKSVQVLASGQGGFWDAVNIAMAAVPIVKGVMGLRSLSKARGWGSKACNSFIDGTLVDTPNGPVPIEWLRPGDWVLSKDQDDAGGLTIPRRVTATIQGTASELLWITTDAGTTIGVTPQHEVWVVGQTNAALAVTRSSTTQADDPPDAGRVADQPAAARAVLAGHGIPACELQVGDALTRADGTITRVVEIVADDTPTTVFNLEVAGTYTYFAEGVWVHNNACARVRKLLDEHHAFVKFLGGNAGGFLVGLPRNLHKKFHSMLYAELRNQGVRRGAGKWAAHFEQHPEDYEKAIDALLITNSRFFEKYGHSLDQATIAQLIRQGIN